MWAGKQLVNEKTIQDYGFTDGSEVFLLLRLLGG